MTREDDDMGGVLSVLDAKILARMAGLRERDRLGAPVMILPVSLQFVVIHTAATPFALSHVVQ